MIIFVKFSNEDEPFELEIEDDCTVELMTAMVASLRDVSPDEITILLNDKILSPDTVVSTLDLGSILYFTAVVEKDNDKYMSQMFDVKQQEQIMQQIHQKQIEDNLAYAYENNPEAFVPFSLLFITCKINNIPVKAMIDTGAQISILPLAIAKQCNVDYLIDRRWKTVTMGVGAQTTVGRIHALAVKVGETVWSNPFSVLEGTLNHCILGVDWLTKNRATVSLESMTLSISGTVVPFEEMPKD